MPEYSAWRIIKNRKGKTVGARRVRPGGRKRFGGQQLAYVKHRARRLGHTLRIKTYAEPWQAWVYGDLQGLHPHIVAGLGKTGLALRRRVYVISGYRSRAEQVALWNRYGPPRAARPGSSLHEQGEGADTYIGGYAIRNYPGAASLMRQHGLHAPLRAEPWHIERITR